MTIPAAFSFTQRPTGVLDHDFLDKLYLDVLRRGLHWIDLEQVADKALSPSQILQTVMLHRLVEPVNDFKLLNCRVAEPESRCAPFLETL